MIHIQCKTKSLLYVSFYIYNWEKKFDLLLISLEIGNAYAVLSNAEKRRQYDLSGVEEPSSPGQTHGGGFDFHRGFEADITPEDLFNMFFGGGFPSCK